MAWLRSVVTGVPRVVFMHRDCGLMTLLIGPGRSLARLCLCLRARGVFLPGRLRASARAPRSAGEHSISLAYVYPGRWAVAPALQCARGPANAHVNPLIRAWAAPPTLHIAGLRAT